MFGGNEDRISNLSDALIIDILSFLDMKDAIRSSLLSRRWRNLWTSIPYLYFEGDDFKDRTSFREFVTQVLLRRDKSDVIEIVYQDGHCGIRLLAESLVHYAVQHGVQELHLIFEEDPFVLPRCLLGCQSLQKLALEDYTGKIRVPANLGLNALNYLYLSGFKLSEDCLDWRAVSNCPNLETLVLHNYELPDLGAFHIYAPNLRTLELVSENADIGLETGFRFIIFAPRLRTFDCFSPSPVLCSMDCPSLEQAIIYVHPDSKIEESLCVYSIKLLNECCNAKSITISLHTLKVISAFPALLEGHHSTFGQLKCLTLKCEEKGRNVELPACILNYFLNGSSSANVRVCS